MQPPDRRAKALETLESLQGLIGPKVPPPWEELAQAGRIIADFMYEEEPLMVFGHETWRGPWNLDEASDDHFARWALGLRKEVREELLAYREGLSDV